MISSNAHQAPSRAPYETLRERLLEQADELEQAGNPAGASALRATVEHWWAEQQSWNQRLTGMLTVRHEINNALVGVRGNAQLIIMSPAGQEPGTRERLEVMLRESGRIKDAVSRLGELKALLRAHDGPESHAA